jgi:hypothetical protein
MSNSQGWIKLHRSILDWEWYDDPNTKIVFLHLLLKANHKDKAYKGVLVKRGEVVTGRLVLSAELRLSEQQIRTSLNRLKSTNEITIKTTNKNSVITIVNYDLYQEVENDQPANEPTVNQQTTNRQPTVNQQVTTNKNVKNNKNEKNVRMKEVFSFSAGAQENIFNATLGLNGDLEKEKSSAKKEKEFGKPEFRQTLIDLGSDPQHVEDWIKVRTAKRATFTQTVLQAFFNECTKNNFPIPEAVKICAERSWQGFKYDWFLRDNNNGKQATVTASQDRQERISSVKRMGEMARAIIADAINNGSSSD